MLSNLKYQMVIQWSDADDCFLVGFPNFSGQQWRTHGETYEEAVTQGIEALESLVMAAYILRCETSRGNDSSPQRFQPFLGVNFSRLKLQAQFYISNNTS